MPGLPPPMTKYCRYSIFTSRLSLSPTMLPPGPMSNLTGCFEMREGGGLVLPDFRNGKLILKGLEKRNSRLIVDVIC